MHFQREETFRSTMMRLWWLQQPQDDIPPQLFRCAHRGRVCMCAFIRMSVYMYIWALASVKNTQNLIFSKAKGNPIFLNKYKRRKNQLAHHETYFMMTREPATKTYFTTSPTAQSTKSTPTSANPVSISPSSVCCRPMGNPTKLPLASCLSASHSPLLHHLHHGGSWSLQIHRLLASFSPI